MAALDQPGWYAKVKNFVPGWLFDKDNETATPAVYNGLAKVMADADFINDYFVTQTFIQQSENPYLALHGFERGLTQLPLESDANFAFRIANLNNTTDKVDIKALVDQVLLVKESTIIEHFRGGPCFNRSSFMNRNEIFITKHYNWASILVPPQKHVPYSFMAHGTNEQYGTFASRGQFLGSGTVLPTGKLMSVVDQLIKTNKAFGVGYRLFEGKH